MRGVIDLPRYSEEEWWKCLVILKEIRSKDLEKNVIKRIGEAKTGAMLP